MPTLHFVLVLFVMAALPMVAKAEIIGHNEAKAARTYSQATMDAIAQSNWYFAHASVGGNMMDGLAQLHASNPSFFRLTGDDSMSGTPPASTQSGIIYGNYRGNPSWQEKVTWFASHIASGWNAPKVRLVANKFCWIDQDADLQTYLNSMVSLEAANPGTTFVYMTMPLTIHSDYQNYQRFLFNDGLRTWAVANQRLFFDVADIEAHAPDGTHQTYEWNGRTCQRLYAGYASDEGHLNNLGAESVALGFYAVTGSQLPPNSPLGVPAIPPAGIAVLAVAITAFTARRLYHQTNA